MPQALNDEQGDGAAVRLFISGGRLKQPPHADCAEPPGIKIVVESAAAIAVKHFQFTAECPACPQGHSEVFSELMLQGEGGSESG